MVSPNLSLPQPILTNFEPRRRIISSVSTESQAIITTTEDHKYSNGDLVRIYVPKSYGMELDGVKSFIQILSETTFRVGVDTFSLFGFTSPPSAPAFTEAHCIPITGTTFNNVRLI